ncbi:MAG: phosphoribosylformylglycinamidine synthase subunit PurL [Candidatus Solibacter usitatus]|nr:phosphoribosylformylglycinamidine synthase subunit PurL [Candidatus Solibacter usitatus]
MSAITPDLLQRHHITTSEYETILKELGREPTLTELGIFSVMWSEHCSYKSSRIHLKKLPTRGKLVVQGPGENAGIIDIGQGYAIAFKIESHNHPSFIEPFQGAATGVGGILRDIFTMGARPIAVLDALRFGTLDDPRDGARNRRILEGVVGGISHYGNCFGVPTAGGECVFEDGYAGNPLVNVFALGVVKKEDIFYAKAAGAGNPVIYVGAKTGRDGVHGATMASAEFTEEAMAKRPNVQVGDPFMEKLLLEACIEAMKTGAVIGIQDMGAAGLTCSTCEMGSRGNVGVEIDLMHVPQRESGMSPYDIMLSESQERMLLVAEKGREEEVFAVFRKWGLDAATIGVVIPENTMRVKNHGVVVAEIPNPALTDAAPLYDRPHAVPPYRLAPMQGPTFASHDLGTDLRKLLSSADLCSKQYIWRQYDYMVRTNTTLGPGADAAVVRIKETGTSVAMSLDGNGRYCYLSPREGAKLMVAECCRNVSTVGALPIAATNNLNFGNPERPEIMAQLVEAIEGMAEACSYFETPITGGNVSLYNETRTGGELVAIYPTPVMGIVGVMPTKSPVPMAFQNAGRDIVLLGGLGACDETRFGGTQYAKQILHDLWGLPPALDMALEKRVQAAVRQVIAEDLAESSHDIGDGGLAVALAECCFSPGGVGANIDLDSNMRAEHLLFHEDPSRIFVSTSNAARILNIAKEHNIPALVIGQTVPGKLTISNRGKVMLTDTVAALRILWEGALEKLLQPASRDV